MRLQGGRAWRVLAPAVFLSLAPLAGGCNIALTRVQLPNYADGTVDGIWFWRLSETTGVFERDGRIQLGAPSLDPDRETVAYVQECVDGTRSGGAEASIVRDASDPDDATLELIYFSCAGVDGTYRASAYNEAGESELSAGTLTL